MAHDIEWYKAYAEEHGYELTDKADKVIQVVDRADGFCPCRFLLWKKSKTPEEMEAIRCPCVFIEEDMEHNKGNCHCFLFHKKEVNE